MEIPINPSSQKNSEIPGLVGDSPSIRDLKGIIVPIAQSDATVLIMGETGTGKEVVARAVHYQSRRKAFPFIPLNCGALPDELFENELFGHERGAYTDAKGISKGVLGEAENGTLFLDEVDSLSLRAQVKVLRLLQEKEYRPLGSSKTIKTNIRLISATNKDLFQLIQTNKFREDLFYRLNVLPMTIPPLRERIEDILPLTRYFLEQHPSVNRKRYNEIIQEISRESMTYDWPGNVRELESMIQRMLVIEGASTNGHHECLSNSENERQFRQVPWQQVKRQALIKLENRYLQQIMRMAEGNVSQASKLAGIDRRSLQRMLRRNSVFGIHS